MTDTHNRFLGDRALSPETLMMGYGYDPFLSERSLKPPVFHTSTFVFRSAQDGKEFFELAYGLRQKRPKEEPGLIYSRINNPDLEMLEDRLAIWDQAEASLVFASGMAAISTTLWAYARPGTVIIHSGPVYGGTDFLLKKILPQFGVTSIGFLAEGGDSAMEEAVNWRAARGRLRRFISKRRPIRPTEWSTSRAPEDRLRPPRRGRQAAGCHRRQYDVGTDVSDTPGTWRRSGRHVADQICRRPFRPDRRRMFGSGRYSNRSAACARSSARCAIRTPAGC